MRSILQTFGLAAGLFLISLPLAAHHSRAIYDQQRTVTLEGVVTKYVWTNPHVYLYVETRTFGALSVIMILLAIRLKPDFSHGKSQTEVEERNRVQNRKNKKLPKRRKDYS